MNRLRGVMAKSFDYLVIGGGSGGLGSARRAASLGANVLIIEHGRLGGTCVSIVNAHGLESKKIKLLTLLYVPVGKCWLRTKKGIKLFRLLMLA